MSLHQLFGFEEEVKPVITEFERQLGCNSSIGSRSCCGSEDSFHLSHSIKGDSPSSFHSSYPLSYPIITRNFGLTHSRLSHPSLHQTFYLPNYPQVITPPPQRYHPYNHHHSSPFLKFDSPSPPESFIETPNSSPILRDIVSSPNPRNLYNSIDFSSPYIKNPFYGMNPEILAAAASVSEPSNIPIPPNVSDDQGGKLSSADHQHQFFDPSLVGALNGNTGSGSNGADTANATEAEKSLQFSNFLAESISVTPYDLPVSGSSSVSVNAASGSPIQHPYSGGAIRGGRVKHAVSPLDTNQIHIAELMGELANSNRSSPPNNGNPYEMDFAMIGGTGLDDDKPDMTGTPQQASNPREGKQPKRFACPHPGCGKAFARNYNLGTHMATHTGRKDFQCPCCPKAFSRKHDLGRHLSALHNPGTSEKPIKCNCGLEFTEVPAYQKHKCSGSAVANT